MAVGRAPEVFQGLVWGMERAPSPQDVRPRAPPPSPLSPPLFGPRVLRVPEEAEGKRSGDSRRSSAEEAASDGGRVTPPAASPLVR